MPRGPTTEKIIVAAFVVAVLIFVASWQVSSQIVSLEPSEFSTTTLDIPLDGGSTAIAGLDPILSDLVHSLGQGETVQSVAETAPLSLGDSVAVTIRSVSPATVISAMRI